MEISPDENFVAPACAYPVSKIQRAVRPARESQADTPFLTRPSNSEYSQSLPHPTGNQMSDTTKPLTATAIHSIYSGKKVTLNSAEPQSFGKTNRFARDPSHSGSAPQDPKVANRPPKRGW
jgi:hypothetical protein